MAEGRASSSIRDDASRAILLRRDAAKIAGALPPLLAEAEALAATVAMGVHGRRRPGHGETFWQYRQAGPGDPLPAIDWRRSGRSDHLYIREMEWEAAQTVSFWVDDSSAMDYRSARSARSKRERAQVLALALSVLLVRAGERVALLGSPLSQPRGGETRLRRLATALAHERADRPDYGAPPEGETLPPGKAVFLSDFMGPRDAIFTALGQAADAGVSGAYIQIVDESEETFPFDGRNIFESMGGSVSFETQRARALRTAYQARLAERRAELMDTARRTGWQCLIHRTSESPRRALLWLYMAIGGVR
ncbi:MAG: DUF58 domain-containing protein [Pseudomonadota bacterium]